MTKSTITRERARQIFLGNGPEPSASEERELARMALAAMDSESGCLPLDYLQGHKDGLEWAAQLAEANHPETGDWLYDDPIELAKAIRKGPDMPPAQPAADSEPVAIIDQANLDYLRSGADADVWPPEREEMGDVLLYRHAQPAPVVPEEWTIADAVKFCKETGRQDAGAVMDAWNACRAAMLAAAPHDTPALNSVQNVVTVPGKWIPVSERMPEDEQEVLTINKMGHRFVSFFDKHSGLFFDRLDAPAACCIEHVLVTHWMPLPAGPQEVK